MKRSRPSVHLPIGRSRSLILLNRKMVIPRGNNWCFPATCRQPSRQPCCIAIRRSGSNCSSNGRRPLSRARWIKHWRNWRPLEIRNCVFKCAAVFCPVGLIAIYPAWLAGLANGMRPTPCISRRAMFWCRIWAVVILSARFPGCSNRCRNQFAASSTRRSSGNGLAPIPPRRAPGCSSCPKPPTGIPSRGMT